MTQANVIIEKFYTDRVLKILILFMYLYVHTIARSGVGSCLGPQMNYLNEITMLT